MGYKLSVSLIYLHKHLNGQVRDHINCMTWVETAVCLNPEMIIFMADTGAERYMSCMGTGNEMHLWTINIPSLMDSSSHPV